MSIIDVPYILYPPIRANDGSSATLDAVEEFVVVVCRVPKTGTLSKIGYRVGTITGSSYTLKVSVETVATTVGQPVATSNAAKTLYATGAESADITSLSSNTTYYAAINGTSGIAVTAGDLVAVTFRLTAVSGSSINIRHMVTSRSGDMSDSAINTPYTATYLGSTWAVLDDTPIIGMQYSDGFTPIPFTIPPAYANNLTYNSGSGTVYYGAKFRFPIKCRIAGVLINMDLDGDANIIVYDSNEYTVKTGFPISLVNTQRGTNTQRDYALLFPTKVEIEANTDYRIILVPTSATSIVLANFSHTADGATSPFGMYSESGNFVLTSRASAPSSGDHTWTDSTTDKPIMSLLIDGIEASSGSGGISRSKQVMG